MKSLTTVNKMQLLGLLKGTLLLFPLDSSVAGVFMLLFCSFSYGLTKSRLFDENQWHGYKSTITQRS